MAILKLRSSRSTKITSNDAAKPNFYVVAHKTANEAPQQQKEFRDEQRGVVKEDSRSEEPEDYAAYYMGKLAATFFGVYEFAANGTYLDGQGGPEAEVESEDERGGNEVTKTN